MASDDRKETQQLDPLPPTEDWESPRLVEYGTAEELTEGAGATLNPDNMVIST